MFVNVDKIPESTTSSSYGLPEISSIGRDLIIAVRSVTNVCRGSTTCKSLYTSVLVNRLSTKLKNSLVTCVFCLFSRLAGIIYLMKSFIKKWVGNASAWSLKESSLSPARSKVPISMSLQI